MSNFAYMSGTGNDFLVGEYDGPVSDIQIIALVSDSEFDVDGVIFVEQIDKLTVKMHYFNNDGSQAELCVCLLYTSPSPRDKRQSRMPSSA